MGRNIVDFVKLPRFKTMYHKKWELVAAYHSKSDANQPTWSGFKAIVRSYIAMDGQRIWLTYVRPSR